ncbi:hypothetical protein [Pseudonocardia alaniniphila]|uniref:Uncharacterized protein n=1 Tax=Pseudonocardia alaniniphila TaxID=75291 RepID=A0ABS9TS96_9PSEU|nr:hypothetical protein [Pseudonocardia alaniniphila]MCH6171233.1 hypothetical protein [Pseudonocardia alaniniphila]
MSTELTLLRTSGRSALDAARPDVATDPQVSWAALVATIAAMPEVAARLLADHVDDGTGRCRGCTRGGCGTPSARFPCTLSALAAQATARTRLRVVR